MASSSEEWLDAPPESNDQWLDTPPEPKAAQAPEAAPTTGDGEWLDHPSAEKRGFFSQLAHDVGVGMGISAPDEHDRAMAEQVQQEKAAHQVVVDANKSPNEGTFKGIKDDVMASGRSIKSNLDELDAEYQRRLPGNIAETKKKWGEDSTWMTSLREITTGTDVLIEKLVPGLSGDAGVYWDEHRANPETLKELEAIVGHGNLGKAAWESWLKGWEETWSDPNANWFTKLLTSFTQVEQGEARAMVAALGDFGHYDRDTALKMMSQDELHLSDIVNMEWQAKGGTERLWRGGVGLATDIFGDLSTYISPFAPMKLTQRLEGGINYGGRVVNDLTKVAKHERQAILAGLEIKKLLNEEGKSVREGIAKFGDSAEYQKFIEQTDQNLKAVDNFFARGEGLIGFDDLKKNLDPIDWSTRLKIESVAERRQVNPMWINELLKGERGVAFNFRIPGTSLGIQRDLSYNLIDSPLLQNQITWNIKRLGDDGIASAVRWYDSVKASDTIAGDVAKGLSRTLDTATSIKNHLSLIRTNTARPIFNYGRAKFLSGRFETAREIQQTTNEFYSKLNDPEKLKEIQNLLEIEPWGSDAEVLARFNKKAWIPFDEAQEIHGEKVISDTKEHIRELEDLAAKGKGYPDGYHDSEINRLQQEIAEKKAYLDKAHSNPAQAFEEYLRTDSNWRVTIDELNDQLKQATSGKPIKNKDGTYKLIPKGEANELREDIDVLRNVAYSDWLDKHLGSLSKEISESEAKVRWHLNESHADVERSLKSSKEYLERLHDPSFPGPHNILEPSEELTLLQDAREKAAGIRASMTPEQIEIVDKIKSDYRNRVLEMRSRGIPFTELNPFGGQEDAAVGYTKHVISREFLSRYKNESEAVSDLFRKLSQGEFGPKIDRGALARAERRTIEAINRDAMERIGVRVFIEDPVESYALRIAEMDKMLRTHDLFADSVPVMKFVDVSKEAPPRRGWIEFDPTKLDYGGVARNKSGEPILTKDNKGFFEFQNFLPKEMKKALRSGNKIYVPQDVMMRLDYLVKTDSRSKLSPILKGIDLINSVIRNTMLFGAGYLGQNMMSNVATFAYAGGDARKIPSAIEFALNAGNAEKVFKFGSDLELNGKQLADLLVANGMMRGSLAREVDPDLIETVIENLATTRGARKTLGQHLSTVSDYVTLYGAHRRIAEVSDDIPKIAYFMSKLDEGYSVAGAAEATNFWFYNFSDISPGQKMVSRVIPFSSFAMKTAETTLTNLKAGNIAHMALPHKIRNTLEGAFVPDPEVRKFQRGLLDGYQKDNALGPLMAGGEQLVFEAPWAITTTKMLFDPARHPATQMLEFIGSVWGGDYSLGDANAEADRLGMGLDDLAMTKLVTKGAEFVLPPTIRNLVTLYQVNNPDYVGKRYLDFGSRYIPNRTDLITKESELKTIRFVNEAAWGKALVDKFGESAIYNAFMFGTPDPLQVKWSNSAVRDGAYGNYIAAKMREITFGAAKMNKIDKQFFLQMGAIQRQYRTLQNKMSENIAKISPAGYDPATLSNPKLMQDIKANSTKDVKDLAIRMAALQLRADALHGFYGYYLKDVFEGTGILKKISPVPPELGNRLDSRGSHKQILDDIAHGKKVEPGPFRSDFNDFNDAPEEPAVPEESTEPAAEYGDF